MRGPMPASTARGCSKRNASAPASVISSRGSPPTTAATSTCCSASSKSSTGAPLRTIISPPPAAPSKCRPGSAGWQKFPPCPCPGCARPRLLIYPRQARRNPQARPRLLIRPCQARRKNGGLPRLLICPCQARRKNGGLPRLLPDPRQRSRSRDADKSLHKPTKADIAVGFAIIPGQVFLGIWAAPAKIADPAKWAQFCAAQTSLKPLKPLSSAGGHSWHGVCFLKY